MLFTFDISGRTIHMDITGLHQHAALILNAVCASSMIHEVQPTDRLFFGRNVNWNRLGNK
jgi:hypothetical protein